MAKELPYFQFEPAQYLTGNIQFCSMEEQGIFINVCAIYWQRSCEATKEQLIRKFDSDNIHRLIAEGVIKCSVSGEIFIEFLDEQFRTITASKEKLSKAGKKGALIKKQATLKPPLSDVTPTLKQLEEIREKKRIEEDNRKYIRPIDFLESKIEIDLEAMGLKSGMTLEEFEFCLNQWSLKCEENGWEYSADETKDLKKLRAGFEKWLGTWLQKDRKQTEQGIKKVKNNKPNASDYLNISRQAISEINQDE